MFFFFSLTSSPLFLPQLAGPPDHSTNSAFLFELLALLYKWASAESVTRRTAGVRGIVKQVQLDWKRRFFRGLAQSRFEAVERVAVDRPGGTL